MKPLMALFWVDRVSWVKRAGSSPAYLLGYTVAMPFFGRLDRR